MIAYPIGTSGQTLIFTPPVLDRFAEYRQVRWWQREAGGQLFMRFEGPKIVVVEATGPRRMDFRSRHAFRPNRRHEQREILDRYCRGLHFVGDWHTHPEPIPKPSTQDEEGMRELVNLSQHQLNAFVLVIVGSVEPPQGLSVSLFSRTSNVVLSAYAGTELSVPS